MHENETVRVLIVDAEPENLRAIEHILASPDIQIVTASSGTEALARMIEREFAVVLLDMPLSDMDGFEAADRIQRCEKTRNAPIIFVTTLSKERRSILKGYASGGVDCLAKL